ncbi:MAG: peptide chain release factor N(5)-glutamine methyltransferase [Candidatus Zixiibacteriota bacterium]
MSNSCLDILNQAVSKLRSEGIDRPRTNAELLLGAVLNAKKIELYLDRDRILIRQQIEKFNKFVRERVSGRPLQYIIGSTEFFGLEFQVNENVLIPRPETETLVETVIALLRDCHQPKIVDLGTGSGAIAISLAKNVTGSSVFATDISPDALKVAEENARRNEVEDRIDFLCGDLFEPLKDRKLKGLVDCVASNPPYVSQEEFGGLPKEVRDYEPIVALKTDQEGTSFHGKIIENSLDFLKVNGILILEVGLGQAGRVAGLIRDRKEFKDAEIKKDLGGIERVVLAHKA